MCSSKTKQFSLEFHFYFQFLHLSGSLNKLTTLEGNSLIPLQFFVAMVLAAMWESIQLPEKKDQDFTKYKVFVLLLPLCPHAGITKPV